MSVVGDFGSTLDISFEQILCCFLTDTIALKSTLRQLQAMDCISGRSADNTLKGNQANPYQLASDAAKNVLTILSMVEFEFFTAWFLAIVLAHPDATATARAAAIKIISILQTGLGLIKHCALFEFRGATQNFTRRQLISWFGSQIPMPPHILLQGDIWITLAAYCAWVALPPQPENDNYMDPFGDGLVYVDVAIGLRISSTVRYFEEQCRSTGKFSPYKLELTDQDVVILQDAMVRAWMFKTMYVEETSPDPNYPDEIVRQMYDLVSSGTTQFIMVRRPQIFDTGHIFHTSGARQESALLAALYRERNIYSCVLLSGIVVLPVENIRTWEAKTGSKFVRGLCHY